MLVEFRNYLSSISDVTNIREENNTISFEYKGLFFWFVTDESDQYYIRLILPNIANADSIKQGVDVHDAINEYNNKYKAVKVILLGNSIWLSMEQFLYSKEGAFELFSRIIGVLETVIISFRKDFLTK